MTDLFELAEEAGGLYLDNKESFELLQTLQKYDDDYKAFKLEYQKKVEALQDILLCQRINRDKLAALINDLPKSWDNPLFDWQDTLLYGLTYAPCKADALYNEWRQAA